MGEFAFHGKDRVKIGTCEDMYYLRLEDVALITPDPHSANPRTDDGLRFRLPFPDEDNVPIGNYANHSRGKRLYKTGLDGYAIDYSPEWLNDAEPGNIQMRHDSGLLINIPCHHGTRLPEISGAKLFWNGQSHSMELVQVKRVGKEVKPVVQCRHCGRKWSTEWTEVLDFVQDRDLKNRLVAYAQW